MSNRKPVIRNSGRIDPTTLSPDTRQAILALKRALSNEGWIRGAQVTFDHVDANDVPPTVDIRVVAEFRAADV